METICFNNNCEVIRRVQRIIKKYKIGKYVNNDFLDELSTNDNTMDLRSQEASLLFIFILISYQVTYFLNNFWFMVIKLVRFIIKSERTNYLLT